MEGRLEACLHGGGVTQIGEVTGGCRMSNGGHLTAETEENEGTNQLSKRQKAKRFNKIDPDADS